MHCPMMLAKGRRRFAGDGDPKKLNEVLDARSEQRNAWHDPKAYREALLPEGTIQSFGEPRSSHARDVTKFFAPSKLYSPR
jgi:hypothetical protein